MFETDVTRLLGIEHPIIGGCMQYISGPEFTAAVCNAGALGIMSSAMFATQEEFREAVRRLKSLTTRPFAVNLNLFPALRPIDNELYARVIVDERVPIVETSGNLPPADLLGFLKDAGVKVMHKCTSIRHAASARRQGADVVTLFGSEGGGHISEAGYTTMVLVPRAVDVLDAPVIAAGGIADGRGLVAALALGAGAAMMGTRLLVSEEARLHRNVKEALVAAAETETVPILGSVHNTLRAWSNNAARKANELEAQGAPFGEILEIVAGVNTRSMIEDGDAGSGVVACSMAVGIVYDIKPVAEIIGGIMSQAADIASRLAIHTGVRHLAVKKGRNRQNSRQGV
jgi:NADH:quinone reductase (non-electrogenic)